MAKGSANSLTVALARCASLSKIARRVGSPSAAKVRSRFLVLFPIMESIDQPVCVVNWIAPLGAAKDLGHPYRV